MSVKIGIIGGTGLDNPNILDERVEKEYDTPYGKPSDQLISGKIKGVPCVLLARHGRKHSIMPTNVNFRANIDALKQAGCTHVIVTTACGSLQQHVEPGDIVILDQFLDRTTKRTSTFYDGHQNSPAGVCHIPMSEPFCAKLRETISNSASSLNLKHHRSGTVVTIEGPRFSSRAESRLFKSWGATVVNMTTVPEVCLANEAGLLYASIALPTDYDAWLETEQAVTVELALAAFKQNINKVIDLLLDVVPRIAAMDWTEEINEAKTKASTSVMLSH
ncbi:S-methyl-5'-thioadenosine phosphorylase [Trichoplax sp. H2]|uniref:S-methyl-5'-thioadenosine phosphorylase n=1 Tax=Trichoplax adhaerens TaxID=10228 RepID=B3S3S2_TRIAD|nr:hypothetical protein TRIADDRAFT_58826 [Trichoplax adhaerens]EDV22519.1 hypothetical protein TRIADDRAFT_58826 [Trichoplax adhaerens]RDD39761.1 S-methyl-5'-thioadenosine phosphorylase [Trichoplax sp. H2]|eukprot:XP_002115063.1 hypothetical protein TRIADDRAFT_58826 [Trichoplax adhaerens]